MRPEQPPEESRGRLGVSPRLQIHIDDLSVLIHRSPQVETLTGKLDEHFVDEERVVESGVLVPKSPRDIWAELVAQQPHRLGADLDAAFGERVLDVAVAETETMVEPDCVLNDGGCDLAPDFSASRVLVASAAAVPRQARLGRFDTSASSANSQY